ncbi:MAG: SgcJ/EcaC family oxidoreductase [Cyclobacteriaceae bacterium]|nr:SgcJ/EcaC family oxidoreductase [Cyclobacteriaceae bacterium]
MKVNELKGLAAILDNSWNNRNAEEFSELFTKNADFQFSSGTILKSKEAIKEAYRSIFSQLPVGLMHKSQFDHVRFLSTNIAIITGIVFLGMGNNDEQSRTVSFTAIVQKANDQWMIEAIRLMEPLKKD